MEITVILVLFVAFIAVKDAEFTSNLTKKSYLTRSYDDLNCKSINVVYGLECNLCGLVIYVGETIGRLNKREANIACTGVYGGYCSDSKTCSSLGGKVEKLSVRCKCGKACCKCTDQCPVGSTCMSEEDTCNGIIDTQGCCGNRVCCTPTTCVTNCAHICYDSCHPSNVREGECCGSTCCYQDI